MFHAKSTLHRAVRMELIPDARFYWGPCNFVPSVRISFPAIFFPPYSVPRVQIDGTQRPFCTAPITRYDHIKLFGLALSRAPPANERAPSPCLVYFIQHNTLTWQYLFFTFLPYHRVPRQPCTTAPLPRSSKRSTFEDCNSVHPPFSCAPPYPPCTIFPPIKNIY
jgi:hypothetical protein